MHEASVSETARAILDYLRKNPDARDTLDGIVQWWLPEQKLRPRIATIKEALDQLIASGSITEHKGKDAQISYRITSRALRQPETNRHERDC